MISFLAMVLILVGCMVFLASPFIGFVLGVLGCVTASSNRARFESDLPELLMFYAAIAGILCVVFG